MENVVRRKRSGALLLETLVASAVAVTMVAAAMPLVARAAARLDGGEDDTGRLSTTLEALRAAMGDARVILEPRAPSGARRGTRLVFIDGAGWRWTVTAAGGRLRGERCEPATGLSRHHDLGSCDGAVFHDRGRTRRVVRVRLRLRGAVLMTSILLHQSAEPRLLPEDGMLWMGPVPVEIPDDGEWES